MGRHGGPDGWHDRKRTRFRRRRPQRRKETQGAPPLPAHRRRRSRHPRNLPPSAGPSPPWAVTSHEPAPCLHPHMPPGFGGLRRRARPSSAILTHTASLSSASSLLSRKPPRNRCGRGGCTRMTEQRRKAHPVPRMPGAGTYTSAVWPPRTGERRAVLTGVARPGTEHGRPRSPGAGPGPQREGETETPTGPPPIGSESSRSMLAMGPISSTARTSPWASQAHAHAFGDICCGRYTSLPASPSHGSRPKTHR